MTVYKEDVEAAKRRVEAWWNHEIIDRAVLQVRAPKKTPVVQEEISTKMNSEAVEAWFMDPEQVIPRLNQYLEDTYFGGEAFPVMFPVAGRMVAITAAYLGCPLGFLNTETVWAHPLIEDWGNRPTFRFDPENKWWQKSQQLLETAVEQADGYFVGVPDLNGPTEILARLRDTQRLALDFYDNPQHIKPALAEINRAWYEYWQACTAITHQTGGYFFWMGIWSDLPATDLQSDFSALISKGMFDEYFLPFIAKQTEMVARTIYHLDGPDAVRHLDSLLNLPDLDGIQWVPGAGAAPAVEWLPLLKRIQEAGKLVYAYCDKSHVEKLLRELNPAGLMLVVEGCESVDEAERLLENAVMWSKKTTRV
jgi:5-methyltetrahydrofolate--homocysteine methyltransferase